MCPPTLAIGGSQINAIDLAVAARDMGHEVLVVAKPGPLSERLAAERLRFVALHERPGPRPSLDAVRTIDRLVREEGIDLVHAYEAPTGLEAYFGALARHGVPVLSSIMSMSLSPRYPRSMPLTMGTPQLRDEARRARGGEVHLLQPPVDTDENRPGAGGGGFRERWGLGLGELAVVTVSRLEHDMKLDGLRRAVEAVAMLAAEVPCRLVVVGEGPAAGELAKLAAGANDRVGREVVALAGPMLDPRPAYDGADIVVGMGGSALRAMAFAKPTVVVGERGFTMGVRPETIQYFLAHGFFGRGDGESSAGALHGLLRELAATPELRERLGAFARAVVCERFGLDAAARTVASIYRELLARGRRRPPVAEVARAAGWVAGFKLRQRVARRRPGSS